MRTRTLALLTAALLFAAACGDGDTGAPAGDAPGPSASIPAGAATATVPDSGADGPIAGIAGLIPPHFPEPSADDWRTFYDALPGLGGWVGAYAAWTPESGTPGIARSQFAAGAESGFRVLPIVGFHQDLHPGLRMLVDFNDAAQVARYAADLAALAADTRPPFLGVGNEVNRIWEADPPAFDAFATALPEIVAAIHDAAPDTRVFVSFQYEFLRGAGALSAVTRSPQWELLDRLAPALDVVAFTTYPYFDFATPAEIPDGYYRDAVARAGRPIAFSEIGWPSAPLAPAPDSAFGGTPEEQAAFIERLPALFGGVDPAFVMWSWAYDTPAAGPTFDSIGLSDVDGAAKPALDAWQRLARSDGG